MAIQRQFLLSKLLFSFMCTMFVGPIEAFEDERKVYIVYMGDRPENEISASSLHLSMVQEILSSSAPDSILYDYKRSFNGFAVKLTEQEMLRMSEMDGVVSIFPNEKKQLETTRSWDFMGFAQNVSRSTFESEVIIGVLDTGIWPESDSFSDQGMGPPPSKWIGVCQKSSNFTCNNKIIGARSYKSQKATDDMDFASPRDARGHGTHTASIAAGTLVSNVSLGDLGFGTARGAVPSARIAVYKVCWSYDCTDVDILAAFDDAIADGVDIISLSVGATFSRHYFEDSIAIGAFHAMRNGILTSTSAGNSGPRLSSTTKGSPWFLSVAASTTDRVFITKVQLGNKKFFEGTSINTFDLKNEMYPIIYGGDAPNIAGGFNSSSSRYCWINSLEANAVKGKIVFCDSLIGGRTPLTAGGVGVMMHNSWFESAAMLFPLAASFVSEDDATDILNYIKSSSNPTATIFKSTEGKDTLAPQVTFYSSRGPNPITSDILMPDISAPGDHILAAWSEAAAIRGGDYRLVKFNINSGTSMACPHATSAAAYVKSFHPTWSPAAVKSALMTTAFKMNSSFNSHAEFGYGADHINPVKAVDPGLIYNASTTDYANFLCGQKYNSAMLQIVAGEKITCSEATSVWDLNYPSFALSTSSLTSIKGSFSRTVTYVGSSNSTYKAFVTAPEGLKIQVNPSILSFTALGETLSFTLTVQGTMSTIISSASLVWDDGVHNVRSPIVVFLKSIDSDTEN